MIRDFTIKLCRHIIPFSDIYFFIRKNNFEYHCTLSVYCDKNGEESYSICIIKYLNNQVQKSATFSLSNLEYLYIKEAIRVAENNAKIEIQNDIENLDNLNYESN